MTDSDDEVRERAFFYINLLKKKGDHQFLGEEVVNISIEMDGEAPESALERDEITQFIFDSQTAIDIDALESFVLRAR